MKKVLILCFAVLLSINFVAALNSSCYNVEAMFHTQSIECQVFIGENINANYDGRNYAISMESAEPGITKFTLNGISINLQDEFFYSLGQGHLIYVAGAGFGSNAKLGFAKSECSEERCLLYENEETKVIIKGKSYDILGEYSAGKVRFIVNDKESKYVSAGEKIIVKGLVIDSVEFIRLNIAVIDVEVSKANIWQRIFGNLFG